MALKFKKPVSLKGKRLITRHTQFSKYAILRKDPELVFDFEDEYYRTGGADTTFSSAITHSITTNATMVDSDGLIKWAPHNLLTYSEDLTEADWVAGAVFLTNISANRITPNTNLNQHRYDRTTTISASAHTFSVEAKPDGYSFLWLRLGAINGIFNLNTGEVVLSSGGTASSVAVGGGYFRVSISGTAAGNDTARINVLPTASTADFSGDGTSGVLIRNVHLYRSDLGGMVNNPDRNDSYVPTTDSARYLPRIGHHVYNGNAWVNEGLLVESGARVNLFIESNDFSSGSGAWSALNVTMSASAETAPDGKLSAYTYTPSTTVNGLSESVTVVANSTNTVSAFVKADTAQWLRLVVFDTGASTNRFTGWFDIQNGVVGSATNGGTGSGATVTIEDFDGFYRISLSGSVGNSATSVSFQINTATADSTTTGTLGVFEIYGAQFEAGSTPSSYIPTNGAAATRAAETLTVAAADLPWPSPKVIGPELVTNGTFDTNVSGWVANADAVVTWDNGEISVERFTSANDVAYQAISTVVGKTYVLEVGGSDPKGVRIANGNNFLLTIASGSPPLTFVATATTTYIGLSGDVGTPAKYDNISVREIDPLSVSIQMDGRMTYADEGTSTEVSFYRQFNSSTEYLRASLRTDSTRTGAVQIMHMAGGTFDDVESGGGVYSPGVFVPYNLAARHGSTFVNGAVDGVEIGENITPVALPDLSATDLQLGLKYMGTIRTFRMWAKDLTDTGIENATLPSLEPSLSLTFDSTENSFIVEDWTE